MVVFPTYSTWETSLGDQELHSAKLCTAQISQAQFRPPNLDNSFCEPACKTTRQAYANNQHYQLAHFRFRIPSSVSFDLLTMITHRDVDVLLTMQRCVLVVCVSEELKVSPHFNISSDLPLSFFSLPALLKIPFSIHESGGIGERLVGHSPYQLDQSFSPPPHNRLTGACTFRTAE